MFSRFRHWSPRYVWDRFASFAYERRNSDVPWLTPQMVGILASWLRPTDVGLEWGAGRSTAWLAKRVRHLTSIEHNAEWAERVEHMISAAGCASHVALHRIPVTATDLVQSAGACYVRIAEEIGPANLDFVLVDGMLRDYCSAIALKRLKQGGILIVDNVERYIPRREKSCSPNSRGLADGFGSAEWERVFHVIGDWRSIWTSNGVSDTALWVKP